MRLELLSIKKFSLKSLQKSVRLMKFATKSELLFFEIELILFMPTKIILPSIFRACQACLILY